MRELDPRTTLVEVDGRAVPLSALAQTWDEVRLNHAAYSPVPMVDVTVSRAAKQGQEFQVVGHASVFGRKSLDLGGFREKVAPGAFDNVLDRSPDVHALWDHDTSKVLARTLNHTLELSVDPRGLRNWMKVAPTSFGNDLRILMERGDIDQQSFAFTVENDIWEADEDGEVTRTVTEVRDLYDVTITAKGAYPQTAAQVVRSFLATDRRVFAVPELTASAAQADPPAGDEAEDRSAAPDEDAAVQDAAQDDPADDQSDENADRLALLVARMTERKASLEALKERVAQL